MFYCPICGSNNAEGKRFCAACGAPLRGAEGDRGKDAYRRNAEDDRGKDAYRRNAENDRGKDAYRRNTEDGRETNSREADSRENRAWAPPTPPLYSSAAGRYGCGGTIEERHILKIYLLTLVTLGFYRYYVCHKIAQDINLICREDGKHTTEGGKFFLFSLLTLGIYELYWYYQLLKRIRNYAEWKGISLRVFCDMRPENGWLLLKAGGFFLMLFLSIVGYVPSVYADYLLYDNINAIARDYNAKALSAEAFGTGTAYRTA